MLFMTYTNILMYSAGTPICMDQFGWSSDEVILKYGMVMASMGVLAFAIFFAVGPLAKRFLIDTRAALVYILMKRLMFCHYDNSIRSLLSV